MQVRHDAGGTDTLRWLGSKTNTHTVVPAGIIRKDMTLAEHKMEHTRRLAKIQQYRHFIATMKEELMTPEERAAREVAREKRNAALGIVNSKLRAEVLSHKVMLCYLCGQRFPHDVHGAHVADCTDKARNALARLGQDAATLPPGPAPMTETEEHMGTSGFDVYNKRAVQAFLGGLRPCGRCGRRMNITALEEHVTVCTEPAPAA